MFDNDWEQAKRDVAKLEKLHAQMSGQKKEILRRLKAFGIGSLKEGIAAKKNGLKAEHGAMKEWTEAIDEFQPEYEKVKDLLRRVE